MNTKNEYWLKRWESSDISFHQDKVNYKLISFIHKMKAKKGDAVFVPLCGKSLDMLWLLNHGFRVVGMELSPIACRAFFSENNLDVQVVEYNNFTCFKSRNIEIFCGDFFEINPKDVAVSSVYDRGALVAFHPDLWHKYATRLMQITNKKADILLLALETSCKVQGPPFPIDASEIDLLFGEDYLITQLKRENCTDISPGFFDKGFKNLIHTVYHLEPRIITLV